MEIDCTDIECGDAPYELVSQMRASYYLLGAELGRFSYAKVALPGGCDFGPRPIDQHIKGFEALGGTVTNEGGYVEINAPDGIGGANIFFDRVTVGATANLMIAAAISDGVTVIDNAAREPHIVDLANFLNTMGADVRGAGTDVIKIRGVYDKDTRSQRTPRMYLHDNSRYDRSRHIYDCRSRDRRKSADQQHYSQAS